MIFTPRCSKRTVAELQGEQVEDEPTVSINLGVDVAIPEHYISDMGQRLRTYKRVSSARDEDALAAISAGNRRSLWENSQTSRGSCLIMRGCDRRQNWSGVVSIDRIRDGIAIKLAEKARVAPDKLMELISVRDGATLRLVEFCGWS